MTSHDTMPFGKYKGIPIKQVPEDYQDWLVEQDWLKDKWPKLYKLLTEGESEELETPLERKNIDAGKELLDPMSEAFKAFWRQSYGERMRKMGELNYIAYLRVAINTWKAATKSSSDPLFQTLPKPQTATPQMLPPPLAHIPAPKLGSASEPDSGDYDKDGNPLF